MLKLETVGTTQNLVMHLDPQDAGTKEWRTYGVLNLDAAKYPV